MISRGVVMNRIFLALLLAANVVVPARSGAQEKTSVTVSAAISLKDALDEAGRLYEQQHAGAKITFNYGGSGTLQRQIEQGAPVDIFFSAAEKQMDALESKHLILLPTRHDIVRNSLVLVTPADNDAVKDFPDLAKPAV